MLESLKARVKQAFAGDFKGDFKAIFTDGKGWKELPGKTKAVVISTAVQTFMSDESRTLLESKGLSRRDFLKLGAVAAVAAACGVKLTEPPKPNSPESEVYQGLLYQKTSGVFKIEEGQGVRAVLNGFEFVSKDQDLTVLPFGGVKYGQGEPSELRDASGLKAILPGFDGGLVVNDSKGIPVSGLVSVSKELFVLTRMEIPNDNLLTMFKLDSGEKKVVNDDGSYVVTKNASMIQRGVNRNTGKLEWAYAVINKEPVKIPVSFEYDKQGNFKGYNVPTINVLNGPTPTPEQQAAVVVKNIAFVPKDQSFVVEKPTPTPAPTASQEATATAQPTPEGPIVDKMIFDRGLVDPSTVKLIINPVNNDDIGRYYDQGSVTTVFVLPEKIFLAKDGKYYCKCYLDTGDPVIFQVGEVRTYVAGERIKLVEESQYGKLSVDFGNRTAGVNIRAQRPSGGWTIRRIRSYLLDATKEVTSLSVQITLTK